MNPETPLNPLKLQALIEDYLEFLQFEQQGSPATAYLRFYDLHQFRRYMEQELGISEFQEIKLHHLRSYLAHLRTAAGYQPVSLGNVISSLRALYNFAVNRGILQVNPAQRLKKPRVEKKEVEHFTWEEVESLFLAVPRGVAYLRDLCILLLLYYCGLRLEELQNIRKSDFSEDLAELYVEKGKGGKSRLLPVHPFLQRVLPLYLNSGSGAARGLSAPASPFLFPGKGDQPLAKSRFYGIVKRCGALAGINKRVSPHTFRHSFATHLHQKGVDINRLAQLLGHSNIEKTAIYTHTEDDELTEAVLRLKEGKAVYKKTSNCRLRRRLKGDNLNIC
ncbi:MAG: tyrosine-type recombinase/integrase [Bacillota bacterium]